MPVNRSATPADSGSESVMDVLIELEATPGIAMSFGEIHQFVVDSRWSIGSDVAMPACGSLPDSADNHLRAGQGAPTVAR
jgi:hypothetical protein